MTLVTQTASTADLAKPKTTAVGAARCTASDLLRWAGLGDQVSDQTDRMPYATRRVRARSGPGVRNQLRPRADTAQTQLEGSWRLVQQQHLLREKS